VINRDTGLRPRFFFLDARVAILLLGFFYHLRVWTAVVLFFFMFGFWWLEREGIDFGAAIQRLRWWVAGRVRQVHIKEGDWHGE